MITIQVSSNDDGSAMVRFYKHRKCYHEKYFADELEAYEAAGYYEKFYKVFNIEVKDVIL